RAGIEAGKFGRDVAVVEQIAWMRHQAAIGEAAVLADAQRLRRGAEVLDAGTAVPAFAAADPRINDRLAARRGAPGIRTSGDHLADDLVTHDPRRIDGLGGRDLVAAAHVEE